MTRSYEYGIYQETRIFDLLKEQGCSLTFLAKQSGCHLSQVSRMRKGERPIPRRVVDAAIRLLGMSEEELFFGPATTEEYKFWQRVNKNSAGCWEWQGSLNNGIPRFTFRGIQRKSSEVAWEISNQPLPHSSQLKRFCDTPRCINPDHHDLIPIFTAEERYWSSVNINGEGCWVWTGPVFANGYGRMDMRGVERYAHRYAYILHFGPIPAGKWVLHHCDNPACVNPHHLYAGTAEDNARDRERRGRGNRRKIQGAQNKNAKLTEKQVREIKRLKGIAPARVLSERFGVTQSAIYSIHGGYSWKHVQIGEVA